jgi:hypothetical protein
MIPAVPLPKKSKIKIPLELKLKSGWRYEPSKRRFRSDSGAECPARGLPKNSKIIHKVPRLAQADQRTLSKPERHLSRAVQVILPAGESAAEYLKIIRTWPCIEDAYVGPEISLP